MKQRVTPWRRRHDRRCSIARSAGRKSCLRSAMAMELDTLVQSLLSLAPAQLVDDASATRAIVDIRWPDGARCIECPSTASLRGSFLFCDDRRCRAAFSIFVCTPLEPLRCPRPRALLLALRAIATDKRGISARALARTVGAPHVTIWRHIHRLRELLPGVAKRTPQAAFVQVCGRRGGDTAPASAAVARTNASFLFAAAGNDCASTTPAVRIVGESIRTWLCGTFHGVTARYLGWYLQEATARTTHAPAELITHVLARLVLPPPCVA